MRQQSLNSVKVEAAFFGAIPIKVLVFVYNLCQSLQANQPHSSEVLCVAVVYRRFRLCMSH